MQDLAAGARTSDPYLAAVIRCKMIYEMTGESIPLDKIDDYPQDWLDAIRALYLDLPKLQADLRTAEGKLR